VLEHLKLNIGKNVVLELANGRRISGKLTEVDNQKARMDTGNGIATIPLNALLIFWENIDISLSRDVEQDDEKSKSQQCGCNGYQFNQPCTGAYACNAFPYQSCNAQYTQPCTGAYACNVFPYQPCNAQYTQPCTGAYTQPCSVPFSQPCTGTYACNTFPIQP
jgi:hypothetical protein